MGIYEEPGIAFAKGQSAAGGSLPLSGTVLISVNTFDHENVIDIARELILLGFSIMATDGTAKTLENSDLEIKRVNKIWEGEPHIVDHIRRNDIQLIINTPLGKSARDDDYIIRRAAIEENIPCITTLSGAWSAVTAIKALKIEGRGVAVKSLQEWHAIVKESRSQ